MKISPEKIAEAQELVIQGKNDFRKGLYSIGLEKLMQAQKILKPTSILPFLS